MKIKMKTFSSVVTLFGASARIICWGGEAPTDVKKPNVVFLLADDLGYGDLGCNGHPYLKTPNLDRFATQGMQFAQFYVSNPVCSPSRASFLTGRYPAEIGVHAQITAPDKNKEMGNVDWLDPELPNMARQFKDAGYATAIFGKWHLTSYTRWRQGVSPTVDKYGFDVYRLRGGGVSEGFEEYPSDTEDPFFWAHSTRWFADDALDFIKSCQGEGKPFFVNLWTLVPHGPLKPTPEEMRVYDNLRADPDDFTGFMKDYVATARNPDAQMQTYCAAVSGMDEALGYFLDQLKELGLEENTIVVFSSDNGPEVYQVSNARNAGMGSPGTEGERGRKRSLYRGGLRVPCIVRWPGHVSAGRVNESTIWAGVDLFPTLLGLTGIKIPDGLNGEDVSPALLGKEFTRQKPLFWEWRYEILGDSRYTSPSLAVQDGLWRAYVNADGTNLELYDLSSDPGETVNIASRFAEKAEHLKKEMLQWKATLP